jgi:hypothetical protein
MNNSTGKLSGGFGLTRRGLPFQRHKRMPLSFIRRRPVRIAT